MANAQGSPVPTMDEFRTMLKRHGLKATKQRIMVHEVMMVLVHASADMVSDQLRSKGSRVTLSSVYNILTQLADKHIYGRRMSAANKMFFDARSDRHVHLYDRENHIWRDLVDEDLSLLVASHFKRRKFKGYTVEDIDIQLIARPTRKNKTI